MGVLGLEGADLLRELLLRGALDREPVVGCIGDGVQPVQFRARRSELVPCRREGLLDLAVVVAGEAPPGVVDPSCRGGRDADQRRNAHPAPVPRNVRMDRHARRGNPESLPQLAQALQLARAPAAAVAHGTTATWPRPAVSGRPNMRFMFCTACPDRPLTRWSISERTTTVSLRAPSGGR